MPVSVRYFTTPTKRRPKQGDRRFTKKHGEQIRVLDFLQSGPYRGALRVSSGRPCYVWVAPEEAYRRSPHLRPPASIEQAHRNDH